MYINEKQEVISKKGSVLIDTLIKKYLIKTIAAEHSKRLIDIHIVEQQKVLENAEKELQELQLKRRQVDVPSWIECILVPLAELLSEKLNKKYDISRPSGIRCAATLYFFDGYKDIRKDALFVTIIPKNLKVSQLLYDTGELINPRISPTDDLDGTNNVVALLPDSLDGIIKVLRIAN